MMRAHIVTLVFILMAATACQGGVTGGAYKASMGGTGATFAEVMELVRTAAPLVHLRDDSTSATEGIFRSSIEGVSCGGVLVQVVTTANDDKAVITSEQSCGPRDHAPTEFMEILQRLQQDLEAIYGQDKVVVEPAYFEPRS